MDRQGVSGLFFARQSENPLLQPAGAVHRSGKQSTPFEAPQRVMDCGHLAGIQKRELTVRRKLREAPGLRSWMSTYPA